MHAKNELSQNVITLRAQFLRDTHSTSGHDGRPGEMTSESDLHGFREQGVGRAARGAGCPDGQKGGPSRPPFSVLVSSKA